MPFGLLDKFLQYFKQVTRAIFQNFEFKPNRAGWNSTGPAHSASPRAGERAGFKSRAGTHRSATHYAAKRYGQFPAVGLERDQRLRFVVLAGAAARGTEP